MNKILQFTMQRKSSNLRQKSINSDKNQNEEELN